MKPLTFGALEEGTTPAKKTATKKSAAKKAVAEQPADETYNTSAAAKHSRKTAAKKTTKPEPSADALAAGDAAGSGDKLPRKRAAKQPAGERKVLSIAQMRLAQDRLAKKIANAEYREQKQELTDTIKQCERAAKQLARDDAKNAKLLERSKAALDKLEGPGE